MPISVTCNGTAPPAMASAADCTLPRQTRQTVSDLRTFIRDMMRQMEEDLGTRLDWTAVDHFNTGHPHSHVVVCGRDDLGKDLIIAQDYITDGMRQRAQERATLELGPETDLELRAKLEAEVAAERRTLRDAGARRCHR